MKRLIQNGLIYDGSGNKPVQSDLLMDAEWIVQIAPGIPMEAAEEVIDATGLAVTPGFVDTHRHCDLDALYNPSFGDIELAQGLTTVLGGNCGLGVVPSTKQYRKAICDFVEPCLGAAPEVFALENWQQYMDALDQRGMPLHVGCYIGTGALQAAIKGYDKVPFTKAEMERAKDYIRTQLKAGAPGLSMGIMYQPECYSTEDELVELLSAAAPYGKPLACHIRGEGDNLLSSVKEMIEICGRAGLPLNISHFKATGLKNWGVKINQAIELIEKARAKSQDVTVDFYPYCGGATTLVSLLPPTMIEGGMAETFLSLATASGKKKLKNELYREHDGWDNMVTAIGWQRIIISSVTKDSNRELAGLDFIQAANLRGYEDESELMADLLYEENGKVSIIVLSMAQEDVDTVARLPYSMVISDALYGASDCPHPRLYGSFPKIIREYVLERGILSMETAIQKMTSLPAKRIGLKKRGLIKPGYYADINIFRTEGLKDHSVYENSKQLSTGLSWVYVDGQVAVRQDIRQTGYKAKRLHF